MDTSGSDSLRRTRALTGLRLRWLAAGLVIGLLPAAPLRADVPEIERYRGSIVVLNFWATWCLPCREEMPDLARIHQRFGGRGVIVHGAAADGPEDKEKVDQFVARSGIDFPTSLGATTDDMERFDLGDALPATVVLDRDGSVAGRVRGVINANSLEALLEWLLGDRTGPAPTLAAGVAGPPAGEAHDHEHGHDHGDDHHDHGEKGDEEAHGGQEKEGVSRVPS